MGLRLLFLFTCLGLSTLSFSKGKKIAPGTWYGEFSLSESDRLPFLFEIKKSKKKYLFIIKNGEERIQLNNITQVKDSLYIPFPAFDSEFRIQIKNKTELQGNWHNYAKKGNYFLSFKASNKENCRYPLTEKSVDVAGKWEVTFDYHSAMPEKAIGLFADGSYSCGYGGKANNIVTGTFLTETGDYRFLEGATIGDSLFLSTFDGSHAFLFTALLKNDTLWGKFRSGNHYLTDWYAIKNENFSLGHPDSLTFLVSEEQIAFSLPNIDGSTYNYPQDAAKEKVTLIQILGTWCPNCLDESNYIKSLSTKYGNQLNVLAIAFETQAELEQKIAKVSSYKTNLELDYTFLIGGSACKSCASDMFPMLNDIISFPTLIFIDKTGKVRKIHTGFNGPGTGHHYDEFVVETNSFVDQLINE